ncbi:MAG TPA: hypothetical protein VNS63_16210 [Blastocatellia bacterium]|nr:hypothetical protein [Blastocatellia bacterium]
MTTRLKEIFASVSSSVERRLFSEYGAIFTTAASAPPAIIFAGASEVERFQASLAVRRARIGDYEITLQSEAMDALIGAAHSIERKEVRISARASDAGARSYQDTVGLWLRNVTQGLEHWESLGRLSTDQTQVIRNLPPADQVAVILDLEETRQLFFGTFFDKSILYSVAAPGASQHLSLLAFDVAEYEDSEVELALGNHGWHRTVPNDLPHFTYLGRKPEELTNEGLRLVTREYGPRGYSFWVPDIKSLK